jgi:hypothetical protein
MHWLFNTYLAILTLAFVTSLISFKQAYSVHLKLFSIFLGISLLTEICANYLIDFLHLDSNYPVYYCFMLVEYIMFAYYFRRIIVSKTTKNIISIFLLIFPFFWLFTGIFIFNEEKSWNSYVVMAGDLFTICVSARFLYELFTADKLIDFRKSPEFWIAAALIFYSCCELPITGILNYLYYNNSSLNGLLQILNIIMYLIFIYAFLCPTTNFTKSSYSQ